MHIPCLGQERARIFGYRHTEPYLQPEVIPPLANLVRTDAESWRDYYSGLGPFVDRYCESAVRAADTAYFYPWLPHGKPDKSSTKEDFTVFCQSYKLAADRLRTLFLPADHSLVHEVTVPIHEEGEYVDVGLFFDLKKLGAQRDSIVLLKSNTCLVRNEQFSSDVDLWEGHLYVFLKIPE